MFLYREYAQDNISHKIRLVMVNDILLMHTKSNLYKSLLKITSLTDSSKYWTYRHLANASQDLCWGDLQLYTSELLRRWPLFTIPICENIQGRVILSPWIKSLDYQKSILILTLKKTSNDESKVPSKSFKRLKKKNFMW